MSNTPPAMSSLSRLESLWLAALLRRERENQGRTQAELGAVAAISAVLWCRVEQGLRPLEASQLLAVTRLLSLEPESLAHRARELAARHPGQRGTAVWRFRVARLDPEFRIL